MLQGTSVASAGRCFLHTQYACDFVVGEVFEVPQHEHFPVDGTETVERVCELIAFFVSDRDLTGRAEAG